DSTSRAGEVGSTIRAVAFLAFPAPLLALLLGGLTDDQLAALDLFADAVQAFGALAVTTLAVGRALVALDAAHGRALWTARSVARTSRFTRGSSTPVSTASCISCQQASTRVDSGCGVNDCSEPPPVGGKRSVPSRSGEQRRGIATGVGGDRV